MDETLRPPVDQRGVRRIAGVDIPPDKRLVTYVSRGFESMRGFDVFMKVAKKIFVFLSSPGSERPGLTVKLPDSRDHGLSFAGSVLPGYGLGKHGWVTVYVDGVPTEERDVLFDFVEESYRAVAPKTLVKRLDAKPV